MTEDRPGWNPAPPLPTLTETKRGAIATGFQITDPAYWQEVTGAELYRVYEVLQSLANVFDADPWQHRGVKGSRIADLLRATTWENRKAWEQAHPEVFEDIDDEGADL